MPICEQLFLFYLQVPVKEVFDDMPDMTDFDPVLLKR